MPTANSWYMGVNVPGKPQVFLPYPGGVDRYRAACDEVVERDYLGFTLDGPAGAVINDGIIRELKPDVAVMLDMMAELGLPPIESMSVEDARAFMEASGAMSPPGPEVGEVVDGTLPGADGSTLDYRLYRPGITRAAPDRRLLPRRRLGARQPHLRRRTLPRSVPAVRRHVRVRQLSPRSRASLPSRCRRRPRRGAPGSQSTPRELGGVPGQLAVAGWSAGANVATVTCQQAKRAGGPAIVGQVLLNPATDGAMDTDSYAENADGYILTRGLMEWFWGHYCDPGDRTDPKASPARADDLSGLPPAMIVTCQFDPLRDEGDAYAGALTAAGVPVRHLQCEGQTHTSLGMVGALVTGAYARTEMADALKHFFGASVTSEV